ncbi:MAG: VWA domain-containing protein, partial [Candidatus Poribacteria bacterium]|nr:VWA domain-containing protein [Candidatus Poribacteria bacterium]
MLQISTPFFFLLLGLIPILLIINRHTRVEAAQWRRWVTLLLRLSAVTCLILALAGLQRKDREDILSVVFLLDVSDSVPLAQQAEGIERMNRAVDALKPTDEFSLILFGGQALVRLPMRPKVEQSHLTPDILSDLAIDREGTNLAGAIQLAMSLPAGGQARQKRLVLLSDGLQNMGEASA